MPRRGYGAYIVRPRHLCKVTRANIRYSLLGHTPYPDRTLEIEDTTLYGESISDRLYIKRERENTTLGSKDRARLALTARPLRKRAFGEADYTTLNS